MKRLIPLFVLLALSLSACRWHQRDMITQAVWADDDSGQAYIRSRWEEQENAYPYPLGAAKRRDFEHQLFIQNPDGSGHQEIYGIRPDLPGNELYYMKSQGYLIVALVEEESKQTRVDRVAVGGAVDTVIRSDAPTRPCGSVSVIPSPDGTLLAVIERSGQAYPEVGTPPSPGAMCAGGTVRVVLLAAGDLSEQSSFEWTVDREVDSTWTPAGDLLVGTYQDVWRIDPIAGPEPAPQPACRQPSTTSSNVSADGTVIAPDTDTPAPIAVIVTDAPAAARFGCQ